MRCIACTYLHDPPAASRALDQAILPSIFELHLQVFAKWYRFQIMLVHILHNLIHLSCRPARLCTIIQTYDRLARLGGLDPSSTLVLNFLPLARVVGPVGVPLLLPCESGVVASLLATL